MAFAVPPPVTIQPTAARSARVPAVGELVYDADLGHLFVGDGATAGGVEPTVAAAQSTFVYTQGTPAAVWTIAHGLGRYPSVTVVDSAGTVCGGSVEYLSADAVRLSFFGGGSPAAFAGTAYLN
jgi:hypothetical protein